MNEVVSVIVPVYNCKEYLERCIESILHQTYPHIQLILVDDGSADGSSEICDCYAAQDARVQVIHQENSGVSTARNRGINVASGHFLYFVDGDDAIATNTLETALNEFDDSVDAVFWGITKNSEPTAYVQELPIESGIFERDAVLCGILKDYAGYGGGYPTNKIWRLTIYDNSEAIPRFNPKLYYFEDLEWVVRMLIHTANVRILPDHFETLRFPEGAIYEDLHIYLDTLMSCNRIALVNSALYFYYKNPDSITRSNYLVHDRFGEFQVREQYISFFRNTVCFKSYAAFSAAASRILT